MGGAAQQRRANPISWACPLGPGSQIAEGGLGGLLKKPACPRPLWSLLLGVKVREGAEEGEARSWIPSAVMSLHSCVALGETPLPSEH